MAAGRCSTRFLERHPHGVAISATTGERIGALLAELGSSCGPPASSSTGPCDDSGGHRGGLHEVGQGGERNYSGKTARFKARIPPRPCAKNSHPSSCATCKSREEIRVKTLIAYRGEKWAQNPFILFPMEPGLSTLVPPISSHYAGFPHLSSQACGGRALVLSCEKSSESRRSRLRVVPVKEAAFRPKEQGIWAETAWGPHSGDGGILPRSGTKDAATEVELGQEYMP